MDKTLKWEVVELGIPEGCNIILGQNHFIRSWRTSTKCWPPRRRPLSSGWPSAGLGTLPGAEGQQRRRPRGGRGGQRLKLSAGHAFVILMRNSFPISVLNAVKQAQEAAVFCATANPLQVLVFQSGQGRGIAGVVDGFPPKGVESEGDVEARKKLLRDIIGYKR